jgi:hypothetical protein
MDDNVIRTRFGKALEQNFRFGTHQMHIELHPRQWPQHPHHFRTERNIGHEMAVHDVQMKPIRPWRGQPGESHARSSQSWQPATRAR